MIVVRGLLFINFIAFQVNEHVDLYREMSVAYRKHENSLVKLLVDPEG